VPPGEYPAVKGRVGFSEVEDVTLLEGLEESGIDVLAVAGLKPATSWVATGCKTCMSRASISIWKPFTRPAILWTPSLISFAARTLPTDSW
jgi:hypothetical protein